MLFHKIRGTGQPVVLIHGLFGRHDNLNQLANVLVEHYQVIQVDVRNHGRSAQMETMTYSEMADDIIKLLDKLMIEKAYLVGHSMGGKIAMQTALNYPGRIDKLCVVDISPAASVERNRPILNALLGIELTGVQSRKEVEQQLASSIKEPGVRQFLLKSLVKENEHYCWQINLLGLQKNFHHLYAAIEGEPYLKPCLFIKGERSDYLTLVDKPKIELLFPKSIGRVVLEAGHWLHIEKPTAFNTMVVKFLRAL